MGTWAEIALVVVGGGAAMTALGRALTAAERRGPAPTPGDGLHEGPAATGRFTGKVTIPAPGVRTAEPPEDPQDCP